MILGILVDTDFSLEAIILQLSTTEIKMSDQEYEIINLNMEITNLNTEITSLNMEIIGLKRKNADLRSELAITMHVAMGVSLSFSIFHYWPHICDKVAINKIC